MDRLIDRVRTAASQRSEPPRGFASRLPAEVLEQLHETRRQFQSGELNVSALWLADQLVAMLHADGHPVCGRQGMRQWLARKD